MRHSNVYKVLLRKVNLNTSGLYQCEVTTKRPTGGFGSESKKARMDVVGKRRFYAKDSILAILYSILPIFDQLTTIDFCVHKHI